MNAIKKKVAIGNEIFTVEAVKKADIVDILIYNNENINYPIFKKESYKLKDGEKISELQSMILNKFIKLYKRTKGDLKKINIMLNSLLTSDINSLPIKEKGKEKKKNIPSDIILQTYNRFLDKDISGIVISEKDDIIFIDNNTIVEKEKVLKALHFSYKITKKNKHRIKTSIGNVESLYISMNECHVVVYPISDKKMCMIVSKNGSIGNIFKKAESIIKHSTKLLNYQ